LNELQSGHGMQRLRELAVKAEPGARLAQETVGPAASYASLSRRASGSVPLSDAAIARSSIGERATAPEPARTMSYEECVRGLGSDKKFFVKPRFAVCNGASFLQTWMLEGRPVGESMFNVRVVGTIARNSRTINFQYYFTDFLETGRTGSSSMPITTKGNIPQSWPSGVRYTRGGNMPGTKTYAQLKAMRTFTQTVTAKPGQGSSGSTDLIFAVYEPAISYTPPAPWALSGSTGGKLFMLARYVPTMTYSAKQGAEERAAAQHIKTAFTKPEDTKPYMSAKKVPGQAVKNPLHRTVNKTRRDDNRKASVKQCKRYWGANYSQGGARECGREEVQLLREADCERRQRGGWQHPAQLLRQEPHHRRDGRRLHREDRLLT
jgi:hypothetical protein